MLLETYSASIAWRWARRCPRRLHVRLPHVLGYSVAAAAVRHLPADLERALDLLEFRCQSAELTVTATLRCWPGAAGIVLELSANGVPCHRWQFPREACRPAPLRLPRGRPALPAQPHTHRSQAAICLRSRNPVLISWVRAAAVDLNLNAVVAVRTTQHAEAYIAGHRDCRLLLLDSGDGLWAMDLHAAEAPFCLHAGDVPGLTRALRKIFHHTPELPAGYDEIAA